MSMVCMYRMLTADEARRVRGGEDYLMSLTAPEVDEPVESGGGPVLDIHKSWHGLHWLLCQDARDGPEPLKQAVLGGEEIGEDLGYGPARLVDAATVRAVAAALAAISRDTLQQRFNPKAMAAAQIYAFDAGDADWRADFLDAFDGVKRLFSDAASRGHSVLIWLT